MPPLAALAVPLLVSAGVGATTAGVIANAVVGFAFSEGLTALSQSLKGSSGGIQQQMAVDPTVSRKVLLGKVYTGGSAIGDPIVHDHLPTGGGDEGKNRVAEQLIAIADHECDGFEQIFVNGEPVSLGAYDATLGYPVLKAINQTTGAFSTDYTHRLWIKFFSGADSQTADSWLVAALGSRWSSNNVGKNVCYFRCTSIYDTNVFSGFPTFNFVLRGAKLYNPSKDSTVGGSGAHRWGTQSTYEWTGNTAVQAYNIARGFYVGGKPFYGVFADATDIPLDTAFAAIAACNETVTRKDSTTEARYEAGCEIAVTQDARTTLKSLSDAMAGTIATGGSINIYAGVAQTPVFTFTDDDLIAGAPRSYDDKAGMATLKNSIFATYLEPGSPPPATTGQQWSLISAPARFSNDDIAEDGGLPLRDTYQFDQIQSGPRCQRVMEITRRKARTQATATRTFGPAALNARVGQWVQGTSKDWNNATKTFQIISRQIAPNLQVTLSLKEIASTCFDFVAANDELTTYGGSLPSADPPAALVPTGVGYSLSTHTGADGVKIPVLRVTHADPQDATATGLVVQVRKVGGTTVAESRYKDATAGVADVIAGLLASTAQEFRLAFDALPGRDSQWTSWTAFTALPGASGDEPAIRGLSGRVDQALQTLTSMQVLQAKMAAAASNAVAFYAKEVTTQFTDGLSAQSKVHEELAAVVRGLTGDGGSLSLTARVATLESATADLPTLRTQAALAVAINTQVNTPTTGLAALVAAHDTAISALDPALALATIGSTVLAVRQQGLVLDPLSEALPQILTGMANSNQRVSASLAYYTNEIRTEARDGLDAQATSTHELGVRLQNADTVNTARIAQEEQVRADAVSAESVLRTNAVAAIMAVIGGGFSSGSTITAQFLAEQIARAGADGSEVSNRLAGDAAIMAVIGGGFSSGSTITAQFLAEQIARAGADGSNASDTAAVSAQVGNFYASGLFRASVHATPTGADSRIALEVAATSGGTSHTAALFLDAMTGGGSRIVGLADSFYLTDGTANANPFAFVGGVLFLNSAVIGHLDVGALIADSAIVHGKLLSGAGSKTYQAYGTGTNAVPDISAGTGSGAGAFGDFVAINPVTGLGGTVLIVGTFSFNRQDSGSYSTAHWRILETNVGAGTSVNLSTDVEFATTNSGVTAVTCIASSTLADGVQRKYSLSISGDNNGTGGSSKRLGFTHESLTVLVSR